jgi:Putative DNA-binding domain
MAKFNGFSESCRAEIAVLYEYVVWLDRKSVLAPEILFTYKVWGSTRMSDRSIDINFALSTPKEEEPGTILKLTEIVLGLSDSHFLAVGRAQMDLLGEAYESGAEDDEEEPLQIPMDRILRRTANRAIEECIIYFSELRDSLRDIVVHIGKRVDTENIVNSDAFWRSFISKATVQGRIEHELWDFKETLTMWHAVSADVRARAKVTTAEDIAAFANADGGCLLVGIRDDKTIAGIGDTERDRENRVKSLNDALAELIQYPRQMWKVHQLLANGADGKEKLCLVVIAARACEPVGVKGANGSYTYPVRHGTGIAREDPEKLRDARIHDKNDNFDFLVRLRQFVRDN